MKLGPFIRAIFRAIPWILRDLIGICGAGLVVWGAKMIYEPAGYIVAGAFLLASALRLGQRG